jgi:hypothetical protein
MLRGCARREAQGTVVSMGPGNDSWLPDRRPGAPDPRPQQRNVKRDSCEGSTAAEEATGRFVGSRADGACPRPRASRASPAAAGAKQTCSHAHVGHVATRQGSWGMLGRRLKVHDGDDLQVGTNFHWAHARPWVFNHKVLSSSRGDAAGRWARRGPVLLHHSGHVNPGGVAPLGGGAPPKKVYS